MKYIKKLTWLLAIGAGLATTSCSESDDVQIPGGLAIDKEQIEIGAEGGTQQLAISASQNWVSSVDEPWLMLNPANGVGSATANVVVDTTLMNGRRSTDIDFIGENGQRRTITVVQFGFGKQIDIKEPVVEIDNSAAYDKREFESIISANVDCKIGEIEYSFEGNLSESEKADYESEREGWLLNSKNEDKLKNTNLGIELDRKARPRSVKFKFRWNMNIVPAERVAKVHLVPQNADDKLVDADGNETDDVVLTVRQAAAPRIEDNRAGDSLSIIMINQKINSMATFDTSDNMRNWSNVTLWEANDAFVKQHPEAMGRVRSVKFSMFNLKAGETLPKEVKNLKFLESFSIASNENNQIREVELGEDICELAYLKYLTVQAYGLSRLPANFKKLGRSLEQLNLVSNNFNRLSDITKVVNEANFPHLHTLIFYAQRRTDVCIDMRKFDNANGNYTYNSYPVGLYGNISGDYTERKAFLSLLTWENLRALELSYCFLEGELPTDKEMDDALKAAGKPTRYKASDFSANKNEWKDKLVGDTCKWLLSGNGNPVTCRQKDGTIVYEDVLPRDVPRVLPKCRTLSLNLNFFTGAVPKWLLFHPRMVLWSPSIMIFNQQERGYGTTGKPAGFSNMAEDTFSFEYYYGSKDPGSKWEMPGVAYPLYYRAFVAAGDIDETQVLAKYKRSKK